jgi:hypothetical protein
MHKHGHVVDRRGARLIVLFGGEDTPVSIRRSGVLGRRLINGTVPETLVFLPAPEFDNDEASARGHGCSPVQPSPRLWPRTERGPLDLPLSFTPD